MPNSQSSSVLNQPRWDVARLAFEAARRAEAMGLLQREQPMARADLAAVRDMANRLGRAGIATATAAALNNIEAPSPDELASLLKMIIGALEASPAPKFEWAGLGGVFDPEMLASLLHVSISSFKRYQSGERETPDLIAARLHFLALVAGDLAGSYNEIGIRRWFRRKRTALDARAPSDVLRGDWDPEDPGPVRVRELARELVSLSAT